MKQLEYNKLATVKILMLAMDINQLSDVTVNVFYNGAIYDELSVYCRVADMPESVLFTTEFVPERQIYGKNSTAEQIIDVLQQIKLCCETGGIL